MSDDAETGTARLESLWARLPECVIEGDQHRKISLRGKTLAWLTVDHHGDGRVALAVRLPRGVNAELADLDPERFSLPPYVARHGYAGIHVDTPHVDWDEIDGFLRESYRLVAPARLARVIDGPPRSG